MALKSGKVDFTANLSAKNFQKLSTDQSFLQKHEIKSQERSGHQLLAFNLEHELLELAEVRLALAYSLPKDKIIENVFYGLANSTLVPLTASEASTFAKGLNPYRFNLHKADSILKANNWKDTDEDGILDKVINGEKKSLRLNYAYNSGNEERKAVGLILKEQVAQIGIELKLSTYDWATYTQKIRNGELEMFYWGVSTNLLRPNYANTYHSEAIASGRNIFRYQNHTADSLIEMINKSNNERDEEFYMQQFFNQLNQDLPCIFLFTLEEGIAYSKTLESVKTSKVRPHYWASAFKWKQP